MSAALINVVLDIETLSTDSDAAVIQIGACVLPLDRSYLPSGVAPEFEATIRYENCVALVGANWFTMSNETMEWWEKQPTRNRVFSGQDSYTDALKSFCEWIVFSIQAPVALWGNSPAFDCSILAHSLKTLAFKLPWNFRNERDYRTMKAIFPLPKHCTDRTPEEQAVQHTALGDARYEARILEAICSSYGIGM